MQTCDLHGATYWQLRAHCAKDLAAAQALVRARLDAAHIEADEAKEIADTELDPQRARNRIEVRKWRAGVFNPKQFGQKIDLTVTDTVNPAALHAEGMRRARLMRDPANLLNGQPIEDAQVIEGAATDKQSGAALPAPAELAGTGASGSMVDIFS